MLALSKHMNGVFVIDARPAVELEAGVIVGAEHVSAPTWELPDDPRQAVILVTAGDDAALARRPSQPSTAGFPLPSLEAQ